MVSRISTYAMHQTTLRDVARTQVDLADLQNQVSSGLKSQDFTGIYTQAEQFLALDDKLSKIDVYLANNQIATSRINTSSNVLEQVIETASALKNAIILRRNTSLTTHIDFDDQIQDYWKALVSQLNYNEEGRYLFSGTRTDAPAVDAELFPALKKPGIPDDGYYQGSAGNMTLRVQENYDMTYNVRADAPAFQNLFAGLATARDGNNEDDDTKLKQAYDFIDDGLEGVISLQATLNANKVVLDQSAQQQEALKLYWQGLKEGIGNADLVGVSTQVAINQGILQAAFQVFSRVNSLRLSDFLR